MSTEAQLLRAIDRIFEQRLANPAVESFARSGSYRLRLCFTDKKHGDEFLPSFLREEAGPADLEIGFLTGAESELSSLVPYPPTEHRTIALNDCFAFWFPGDLPMLYLLNRKSRRALIWMPAGAAPDWIASRPALPIMYAFSVSSPWVVLHAAAVGLNDRFLLLAGDGRVGKTTAAVSCARAGWTYAGDDYVYANTTSRKIEPLYCSARLRADMAKAFPDLADIATSVSNSDGEARYELRLAAQLTPSKIRGGSLAAILLPRRRGSALPQFSPARRIDALSALNTSMMLAQLGWLDVMINKAAMTVGLAPVFFVDTGQEPHAIPDAFAEFLDRLE